MNKEDIEFLISIQDLEQPDFDNACLERENNRLNKEIERLNNKYNYALKLLADFNMPCECCDCKISDEYCEENCSVDDECYKKCWNKYIELELKEGK